MKIDHNSSYPARPCEGSSAGRIPEKKPQGSSFAIGQTAAGAAETLSDTVHLVSDTRQMESLKARLQSEPDIRWDRVASLREKIRSGSYHVSNEKIADAIISELF